MRSHLMLSCLLLLATTASCGDDTASIDLSLVSDMSAACTGKPATGDADHHCVDDGGTELISVDPSQCTAPASGDDADYGDTNYGLSSYDDDCKYAVSYTVDPICRGAGTFFIVTLKDAKTGALVPMAKTRAEVFLNDTHPAPNSGATYVETSTGVYKVGPIVFDAAGTWTVRFHFFEDCTDSATSPHGHAAYYMNVP